MKASLFAAMIALATFGPARSEDCGPDKLGTSRVQKVGAAGGLLIGLKSYPRTIPLADHEVIITFDDGPDPKTTPEVLKALAAECVRATFFVIGRNTEEHPDLVRREVLEGHEVAHHTFTHPQPTLRFMSDAAARADILRGMIAIEKAAFGRTFPDGEPKDLGEMHLHTPWFRFPGFADTPDLRAWFATNGVGIFGVDMWASDWVRMTPDEELKLILGRLEAKGRGMLLFHDNKPWTAEMMPRFLRELKKRGYKIVAMAPGPGNGPTTDTPVGWKSETEAIIGRLKPRLDKPVETAPALRPEVGEPDSQKPEGLSESLPQQR